MDFYSYALIRNFIRFLIEENPSDQEIEAVPNELKENLCSLDKDEISRLIDETLEFISIKKVGKQEVLEKVLNICTNYGFGLGDKS